MFFLIQNPPVMHTSLSVDINLGTLSLIHEEPKLPHESGESTSVFIRRTSTARVPTSSIVTIFRLQIGENISALPSNDAATNSDIVSDVDVPMLFARVNTLAHSFKSRPIYWYIG